MSKVFRPTICVDFDGVIHSYERGWQGGAIYGTVTEGFWAWAESMQAAGADLVVYSSRSKTSEGIWAMRDWLAQQWREAMGEGAETGSGGEEGTWFLRPGKEPLRLVFSATKPAAFYTIDDRCARFRGDWADFWVRPETIMNFKPWNQKKED